MQFSKSTSGHVGIYFGVENYLTYQKQEMQDPFSQESLCTGIFQRVYRLGHGAELVLLTGGAQHNADPNNEWASYFRKNGIRMVEFEGQLKAQGILEGFGQWEAILGDNFFVFRESVFEGVYASVKKAFTSFEESLH